VDGFKAYRYYLAIKLHFTTEKFNVFENRGNVKGTRDTFNARNDRYIFEKLASKHETDREIIQFFVANFAYGSDNAIYEGKEAADNFLLWNKRKQSITQVFIDDLANILNFIDTNKTTVFTFENDKYPALMQLYMGSKITIETLRIIDDIHPFLDSWSQHNSVKYMWSKELLRIKKLTGFVKYDKIKIEKIFKHFLEEITI
jgi:hypothetical protein